MATLTGKQLAQDIRQKIAVLKTVCDRVAEKTSTQAPEGRWSPKEILSHLAGPEGYSYKQNLQAVLDEDTPRLDLRAENPFFSDQRARTSFAGLFAQVQKEYEGVADFAAGNPAGFRARMIARAAA
jgi:hypothetical protein